MVVDGNFKAFTQQITNDFTRIIYELISLVELGGPNVDGAAAGEIATLSFKVEL
jgi:hypothetical protein